MFLVVAPTYHAASTYIAEEGIRVAWLWGGGVRQESMRGRRFSASDTIVLLPGFTRGSGWPELYQDLCIVLAASAAQPKIIDLSDPAPIHDREALEKWLSRPGSFLP